MADVQPIRIPLVWVPIASLLAALRVRLGWAKWVTCAALACGYEYVVPPMTDYSTCPKCGLTLPRLPFVNITDADGRHVASGTEPWERDYAARLSAINEERKRG